MHWGLWGTTGVYLQLASQGRKSTLNQQISIHHTTQGVVGWCTRCHCYPVKYQPQREHQGIARVRSVQCFLEHQTSTMIPNTPLAGIYLSGILVSHFNNQQKQSVSEILEITFNTHSGTCIIACTGSFRLIISFPQFPHFADFLKQVWCENEIFPSSTRRLLNQREASACHLTRWSGSSGWHPGASSAFEGIKSLRWDCSGYILLLT